MTSKVNDKTGILPLCRSEIAEKFYYENWTYWLCCMGQHACQILWESAQGCPPHKQLKYNVLWLYVPSREYTFGRSTCRWYTVNMHGATGANLLYVSVWLLHQLKGSSVWTQIQRYCWISRSGVELKVPYRCSKSIVLSFSVSEQSTHYFHWLMVSRRRPEKLRCIDWWRAKVSLNLRFGQKPAVCWWNFGGGSGGAPFLHFRRRRRHNYSGGVGSAARPAWGSSLY